MDSWKRTKGLIDAAKGGDRTAFADLVVKHQQALEAYFRREVGKRLLEKVEIDDLVQDALLRAFRSIGQFDGESSATFESWLRGIAAHVILDQARRLRAGKGAAQKEVSIEERRGAAGESWSIEDALQADGETPSQGMRRSERFERLERVLRSLKPDHARVIYLARVEGLPIKEVARRMDRTPEATSMLLLRALVKLKEAFGSTESFHLPGRKLAAEGGGDGE